jgi:dihydroorotase-like cyclic amidohydrolase
LTIQEYARVSSENAARVYGLWPQKGRLAVGADADITIVETGTPRVIDADQLHSRARVTPFDGVAVSAQVTHTFVRGTLVAQDGKIVSAPTGHDVRQPIPGKG